MKPQKYWRFLVGIFVLFGFLFFLPQQTKAQFSGELASISGSVTWGTILYPGNVFVSITGNSTGFSTSSTSTNFNTGIILPADTYMVTATARPSSDPIYWTTIGTQTVAVSSGQVVTGINFDTFNLIGLAKGSLKINGSPAAGYVQFCSPQESDPCPNYINNSNGPWFHIESNGLFTAAVRPGNYRVHVITSDLVDVGKVPVTVTAGQIFEDPSLQFSLNLGSISGSVTWGTEIPSGGGVGVFVDIVGNNGFSKSFTGADFITGFILPPDTYTVSASIHDGSDPRFYVPLGSQTVTVASGQAVVGINFDAFNLAGAVKGSLKINGVAASGYVQFCGPLETDPCTNMINNSNGPWVHIGVNGFTAYILPGQYRAHVITQDLVNVGIVPITVTAGQILADSSLQFSINLGSISGSITWGTIAYPGWVLTTITGNTTGFTTSAAVNFNTGAILPPDTYTITAIARPHGNDVDTYSTTLGTQSVTVAAGQAVTGINFDALNLIGLVKGSLKINGSPAAGYVQFCGPQETDPCPNSMYNINGPWFDTSAAGLFTADLRPGNYRAHVVTSNLVDIGRVPVTVIAGQILDLSTAIANVPVGQNIQVSLEGVTITFPEVTNSGVINLTTTTQSQGGLPPSEYKFLGTYYELTTTAIYTGPITVSFTYSDADVHGLEKNLKLFHWDGTSWQNITVPPVDTVNNIITGSTQTLSPFAIGEPLYVPVVGAISAPLDPQLVNQAVNASASFTDSGASGTYTALWNWGDGITLAGTVNQQNKYVSNSHVYITPGVYTVTLSVTKENGVTGESSFQYIVIYNPDGGFVTGGGTIDSPVGAYTSDPAVIGKASFGFISKYEHGANILSGQTEFHFKVANFNFHSTSYDWLVIAGAHAKYKGSGTINGVGDYAFMLTATDGQVNGGGGADKFRIKIWNKANGQIIYDNQLGSSDDADATMAINNGSIVIHN